MHESEVNIATALKLKRFVSPDWMLPCNMVCQASIFPNKTNPLAVDSENS